MAPDSFAGVDFVTQDSRKWLGSGSAMDVLGGANCRRNIRRGVFYPLFAEKPGTQGRPCCGQIRSQLFIDRRSYEQPEVLRFLNFVSNHVHSTCVTSSPSCTGTARPRLLQGSSPSSSLLVSEQPGEFGREHDGFVPALGGDTTVG